ncbi:hypothetical protein H7J88_01070 [Mycolicibacterium flavescens]|uniref:Uncharacterized protein n=1 Tax=Mycolicibacterium flavescens TaxID=1776 RepID=A0A1E3RNM3_MYCFV|nr:hypothetical protein [Mycolicibacterium flavescens]MCV7278235.1 hypothetical protein [Mycolicibacterium flavescens]ODQ91496.1 hypothetical protein BHQ18_05235 [Mycolicibacterium flavescens]
MSRGSDKKKARRRKRQAARDQRWVPDQVLDALTEESTTAAVLEAFDARITERGWVFDEDLSDEESALWFYPPSHAEVPDEDLVNVTTIVLTADDVADIAHVVFVGTADDYQFDFDELFANLELIEAHRLGDPIPGF